MTTLRRAWADLPPRLTLLEPLEFSPDQWSVLERLRAGFNDRAAHTRLPMPIARFRDSARKEIHATARTLGDVVTVHVDERWHAGGPEDGAADAMAGHARAFQEEVDAMMAVLLPSARYRKGHYAYGLFTVPEPHGLHTDHSAEDPGAEGEPICIARIETLATHYVAGDDRSLDPRTQGMLKALRYWTPVPEGEPEEILDALLQRGILRSIPLNHVVLMVAGNASPRAQITQHIAARPPRDGLHSAFFQRQYRLT
jgi:hypothetical protein